ncbi:GTP-binding protein 10 isoform X2 [Ranitomeya variabilis]|uniref:GTP-binding protein 10 isoform X2 n=1 Tax=Ranitomeya variabilis TaxID=490064 RepID=UPI00405721ED
MGNYGHVAILVSSNFPGHMNGPHDKYGNFIDNLRILVKGGAGGMGLPRLGGEGGKGGDVWVVAKDGVTMKHIKSKFPQKRFVGGVGVNSSVRSLKGTSGADCQVEVPVGIAITTDTGTKIGDLDRDGDKLRVARGGLGGGYRTEFLPAKGQKKVIRLDMKLIADVGLVGFPNAGKSSLLSSLSHAKPQIADYPFTTVQPELGKIMYPDFKQISVADLPGLIEGAHRNRGRGHKFLKHVERTKQLLFVVDVSGFQLSVKSPFRTAFETVQLLTLELELYKEDLLDKPALLAVNKMDLPEADDKLRELVKQLENPQDYLHTLPEELVPDCQINFKEIIPISVATNQGISELTRCIRRSIDEHAELEIQQTAKEKLRSLHITSSQSVRQLLPPEPTLD